MSAIAARRRRATRLVAGVCIVAVVIVVVSGLIGANALYNSSDGTNAAAPDRRVLEFPDVSNFLLGVVDHQGRLASIAVFTERPGGDGGSIVSVPVNAAVRVDGRQLSVGARFEGTERSLEAAVGGLLGLSFDDVTIVRQRTLAKILAPFDGTTIDLPAAVVDEHDGVDGDGQIGVLLEAGEHRLAAMGLARVLTAYAESVPDDLAARAPTADENDLAVWKAIADQATERSSTPTDAEPETAGAESGSSASSSAPPVSERGARPGTEGDDEAPGAFQAFASKMFQGNVEARGLASTVVDSSGPDDAVPLVRLERADVLLVFGQISPRRVAAPAASFNVRLVAPYADDDVPGEAGAADVAAPVIRQLVAAEVNVVSVSTTAGDVPETTTVELINLDIEDMAERLASDVVGDHELETADYEIPGIDVVITLGEDYLGRTGGGPTTNPTSSTTDGN